MRKITALLCVLFVSLIFPVITEARQGCCSTHGGVCGCKCCDGTSLSSTCRPYYPECNGGSAPAPVVKQVQPTAVPTKRPVATRTPTHIPTLKPTATYTPAPTATITPTNTPTSIETPAPEKIEVKAESLPIVKTETPKQNAVSRFFNWLFGRKQ